MPDRYHIQALTTKAAIAADWLPGWTDKHPSGLVSP
jgi:hypothetical protein